MGRKPLSEHPPEVAAKMRADLSAKMRAAWKQRDQNGLGARINGSLDSEVQARISDSVKRRWQDGTYIDRVNGMTSRSGARHPRWEWGKPEFRAILLQHEEQRCAACGVTVDEQKIDAHHIDEDHDNYLLSNLVWLCVPCHMWKFHYDNDGKNKLKRPFVTIRRSFAFEYAHILPWHPGKCADLHGHSGHLEVAVRQRLDPNDVVMDFADVSGATKAAVVDVLDHKFLNDWLPNPTSEGLLVWAWRRLESVGLKGLSEVTFSETDTSRATITTADMLEAFGWDKTDDGWELVGKNETVE